MSTINQSAKQEEAPGQSAAATPVHQAAQDPLELMGWLPCDVTLEVPAVGFTIEKLLKLSTGMLVETGLAQDQSFPVQVNGKEIALSDIDTVGDHLAFRITEIL